jgi:peptidoglycan/LPS O-acetylase OafA/YrhL
MFLAVSALIVLHAPHPNVLTVALAFSVGVIVQQQRLRLGPVAMVAALALIAVAIVFGYGRTVGVPGIAVLAIALGRLQFRWQMPDLSYGTYLYAFPVTQGLIALGMRGTLALFVATMAIVIPIAAASWFLLEKPALGLKSLRLPERRAAEPVAVPAEAN